MRELLRDADIEMRLVAGVPAGAQAQRMDESRLSWVTRAETTHLRFRGRVLRTQRTWTHWAASDCLVYEASGGLLDTSVAIASCRKPIALWGHIENFVATESKIDRILENWQLRHCQAVLAYTPRGAEKAREAGVEQGRITTLFNTIDTEGLANAIATMTRSQALDEFGLVEVPPETLAYIGGLDQGKRVEFLSRSLDLLWERRPGVKVLVAGSGSDAHHLTRAVERGQVVMVGTVGDSGKAAMAHLASGLMMPGRVGLVAVDSFTMGLPIITTNWKFHAPEFEYLSPGVDSVVTPDDESSYVTALVSAMDNRNLESLREGARLKSGWPSTQDMAQRFFEAIVPLVR